MVPPTQKICRRTIQSLLIFTITISVLLLLYYYQRITVVAWTNLVKSYDKGQNLWWWWVKEGKKPTQEPSRLTHSNASQILLSFSLLIFHGAIYYCRMYNTTQAISLVDYLYLILKSVLHNCGTLWFQLQLIRGSHLGTSITGIMRTLSQFISDSKPELQKKVHKTQ